MTPCDARFFFNGINGSTGRYLLPPLTARLAARLAEGAKLDPEELAALTGYGAAVLESLGPKFDPEDLASAGWGVIFAPDVPADVKEALSPLLQLRRQQAGDLYTDFPTTRAYCTGDRKADFLFRSQAPTNGIPKPGKVPYYLLIVGSPDAIPFRFQYQLDVQYAVGRLHFDTADEYARYAEAVVAADTGSLRRDKRATFFGVQNPRDRPTKLSSELLIQPLYDYFVHQEPSWKTDRFIAADATRARLADLLGGASTPALLVTASHGLGFLKGDERQRRQQGAIVCQEWPGPGSSYGPIPEGCYLAGEHIPSTAGVSGLVAFFFACYGGGTPQLDDFAHLEFDPQSAIAPHAFVAALPQRLLGHPKGSALAIIGHVERAWGCSFLSERETSQTTTFEATLQSLMGGERIGAAMDVFNRRYSELSSDLTVELEDRRNRRCRPEADTQAEDEYLAGLWTANNDARSYVILGDPAVRLAV